MPSHFYKKFCWGTVFITGRRSFIEPETGLRMKRTNRRTRVPIGIYLCHIKEKMTMNEFPGKFRGYKLTSYKEVKENEGLKEVWEKMENTVRPTRQNPTPEASPEPNPDIATIIAQQLQNIIPQIVTQVTANVNNGNGGNGNGGNDGCSYKTFTVCNPKEFDGKGGAVALTRWIEKMESVFENSGCTANQRARRMIPEPGDTDREVPVPATFHEQTDDELTVAEIKQMEADDQAIQTILLVTIKRRFMIKEAEPLAKHNMLSASTHGKFQQSFQLSSVSPRSTITKSHNRNEHGTETHLMAKAFKLNYSTPTNNNHRISSNPRNRQIAQPVQNVGNQVVQDAVQNQGFQILVLRMGELVFRNIGKENGVAARPRLSFDCSKESRNQHPAEEFDLMVAIADLEEIEEVNENYILMANLQQASTSGTQTDNAPPSMIQNDQLSYTTYDNCYE
ncbi:hypothetical protein Tco_1505158 [Tanacetum coccineum]